MSTRKTPIADREPGATKINRLTIRKKGDTQVEIDATGKVTGPDPEIARVKTATASSSAEMKSVTDTQTNPPVIHSSMVLGNTIFLSSNATLGQVMAINGIYFRVNGVPKLIATLISMPA